MNDKTKVGGNGKQRTAATPKPAPKPKAVGGKGKQRAPKKK